MDEVRTEFGVGRNRVPAASAGNRESLLSANAKVLVVEDDPANQQALCALLRVMGYTATAADGGTEALRLLHTPMDLDLIISDVVMPGMSGIDFAKRARIARPGMPIVLVTGDAYAVDAVLASGSIALLKPYTSETLQRVLSENARERFRLPLSRRFLRPIEHDDARRARGGYRLVFRPGFSNSRRIRENVFFRSVSTLGT
jgi:CheY-like chemotaxis protein